MNNFDIFDGIYGINLVFKPDCYKLCGDAHCCNFSRYKSEFSFLSRNHFQELPLLPGEYEYLDAKGYLKQFGDFEHRNIDFEIPSGTIRYEAIVSTREGCACDHATRTAICRLYPLLPQFGVDCSILGVETIGVYESMERIAGLEPACKLKSLPFDQLNEFLKLTGFIGSSPQMVFYIEAYRKAKAMAHNAIEKSYKEFPDESIFRLLESKLLRNKLFEIDTLRSDLEDMHSKFAKRHGRNLTSSDPSPK